MTIFLALAVLWHALWFNPQMFPFSGNPPPAGGGPVISVGTAFSGYSFTVTGTAPQSGSVVRTAGDGIFCIASWDTGSGTVAISNVAGDTWNAIDTWIDASVNQSFATVYVKSSNGNAADVVTGVLTGAGSITVWGISCLPFSGQLASPLDTHVFASADTTTSITSGTFTTGTANELIVAGLGSLAFSLTWTAGNIGGTAATIPSGATATPYNPVTLEYRIVASTQSGITAAATVSSSSSVLGIGVATFK